MLNKIWIGLILIAVVVAAGRDISELARNRFQNGRAIALTTTGATPSGTHVTGKAIITRSGIRAFYGAAESDSLKTDTMMFPFDFVAQPGSTIGTATLSLGDATPPIFTDIATANGDATKLIGTASYRAGDSLHPASLLLTPPEVYFRVLTKVTNEGVLKMADTAVQIALGLIGVMTLWLGIMKIAEAGGLVTLLARAVRPIMVRLFPDVPAEHPAMGAMVMNLTANFLGLSNAATPLGLKAMEELNNLNPTAGTATNAMCMFLTINTTALTLIPATVIAIRLTLGSKDPSEIIMPTFLATLVSLILGVFFTRMLERFYPLPPVPVPDSSSMAPTQDPSL